MCGWGHITIRGQSQSERRISSSTPLLMSQRFPITAWSDHAMSPRFKVCSTSLRSFCRWAAEEAAAPCAFWPKVEEDLDLRHFQVLTTIQLELSKASSLFKVHSTCKYMQVLFPSCMGRKLVKGVERSNGGKEARKKMRTNA